jgi:glucose 1-dehydrogenase/3-oxoacyl-[acyl-carrier protein] reductase
MTGLFDLSGRAAIVTGANTGIGQGIAVALARAGAEVLAAGRSAMGDTGRLIEADGGRMTAVKIDLEKPAAAAKLFDAAWDEHGPIDILVNNAGIETITPFLELTDDQWTRLTDVNLRGCWLCSQVYCRRAVAEGRGGNIVHIGSVQSAKSLPGRTHYAPTKLGLEALTRNMSTEVAPLGIRVNCVHPGLIETDMTDWVMKDPEILPQVLAQISLGRAGQPREVGTVVAFFASDEAQYVTGQSLLVEGGFAGK